MEGEIDRRCLSYETPEREPIEEKDDKEHVKILFILKPKETASPNERAILTPEEINCEGNVCEALIESTNNISYGPIYHPPTSEALRIKIKYNYTTPCQV